MTMNRVTKLLLFFFALSCSYDTVAQETAAAQSTASAKLASWPPEWLKGAWKVSNAKIIENEIVRSPEHGHQDVLLFSDKLEIELYLPDAEKHRSCYATGSRVTSYVQRDSEHYFCQTKFVYEGKKKTGKFSLKANDDDYTSATITFFNRRDSGEAWMYELELKKIDDFARLSQIATSILPFLKGTAKIEVFGARSIGKIESTHRDFLTEWANNAMNSESPGPD